MEKAQITLKVLCDWKKVKEAVNNAHTECVL